MCSNIMGGAFDIRHAKYWSHDLEGAYLHRPIVLPLWSWGLLMEYPQDHFTLDALDGKRGGKKDEVVDGDIYYYDVIFLSWVSKHEGEGLQSAPGSFLFMEVCQTTMEDLFMDPCVFLLQTYGEILVCATQYLHALTISW